MCEGETTWAPNGAAQVCKIWFGLAEAVFIQETRIKNEYRILDGTRKLRRVTRWRRATRFEAIQYLGVPQ